MSSRVFFFETEEEIGSMSCLQCQDLIRHTTQIFCKKSWYSVDVEHPCFRIKIKMSQITQRFLAASRQRKEKKAGRMEGRKKERKREGREEGREGAAAFCFGKRILLDDEIYSSDTKSISFQHLGHCFWMGCPCAPYMLLTRKESALKLQVGVISPGNEPTRRAKGVFYF